ncbi:hypothetical protein OG395_15065 [Streptomyces sp. NBC_01320]|nr:hypothetical protein OG395_15065 [Streptomyces sp. NBC_01320]
MLIVDGTLVRTRDHSIAEQSTTDAAGAACVSFAPGALRCAAGRPGRILAV